MGLTVYYDGDCPLCRRYTQLLRLRESAGAVTLVSLRDDWDARHRFEQAGYDLDQGMIVETGGRTLAGAEAMNALALLSTNSTLFNALNHRVLSSRLLAALLYPVFRSGRWLVLFFMGREGLQADDPGTRAHQTIFGTFFALFSIFHFMNYALEYHRFPPALDQLALLLAAGVLFFRPSSARALWLLVFVSTVSTIVQAPAQSNHTMVRSAVLLGYWLSFFYAMIRGTRWSDVFANFTLAGRGALLGMYFFGIFHKINTGFLNPETSCAVALWRLMPPPLAAFDTGLVHYAAIYGTFIVEGALVVALLIPRLRHYGIVGGILFHLLLAMSSYAMYITFTMLSISLHTLFLSNDAASRILESREMRFIRTRMANPVYWLAGTVLILLMVLAAIHEQYSLATALVLPIVLPFCALVIAYGRPDAQSGRPARPAIAIGVLVTALFFINGFMPYFGLKSAQAVNMFANLRLEAGVSNHLVFSSPPGPFTYLDDVATITDAGGSDMLEAYKEKGLAFVYYDLLAYLDVNPDLIVSFTLNGRAFENVGKADLQADIDERLHPAWIRKWFHFQPVSLLREEPCTV